MTAYNLAAICALRILGAPPSLEVVGRGGVKRGVSPLRRFLIDQPSRGISDRSRTGRHTSGMGHKLNHCLGNSVNYIEYHRKY